MNSQSSTNFSQITSRTQDSVGKVGYPASSSRSRIATRIRPTCVALLALFAAILPGFAFVLDTGVFEVDTGLSFNRDVRPILAENCFACHGPDSAARKANLRLDRREMALARGVMAAGDPQRSKLILRVFAIDSARRMPPPSSHKKLTGAQKDTLRRWVAQGANYEQHWSLAPLPASVIVPKVQNTQSRIQNPIDSFVLARLKKEGIRPSPAASREIWLRRVSLDLLGLPPTLEEIEAYLSDRPDWSDEKVVDRLLASPHFGERMATPWLDVARYADSYGYQSDQLCTTWPYRDWVVSAFNQNFPYSDFITWQVAGDLLPRPTSDSRLATAFNRLHRMTNEGGSVPEEWRLEGVADRVNTFGMAFLGFTLECARCHDHKFDPITQRDYYSLSAFFNTIDEHGLYDRADIVPSPSILVPTSTMQTSVQTIFRDRFRYARQDITKAQRDQDSAFQDWLKQPRSAEIPGETGRFSFETFEGTRVPNLSPGATKHGARQDDVSLVDGKVGKAIELDGENNVNFPDLGRFTRHTPFTLAFWMWDPRIAAEPAVTYQACSGTDTGPHGYDLLLEKGRLSARMFRHWPGNGIGIRTKESVPKQTWTHVTVTYDGSSRADGFRIYLNGKIAEREILRDRLYKGTGVHTLAFGQRFRDKGFKGGRIDELRIFERNLSSMEVAQLADGRTLTDALSNPIGNEARLREYYFAALDPEMRKIRERLIKLNQDVVANEDAQLEVAVMEEMPQARPTYVLERGRYDAPKTPRNLVRRDTPKAILPFPTDESRNRLGLARWLTSPENPLTARVAVNRIWAMLMGRGLVETQEDFGYQGKPPSHPELLDWLARDFIKTGWNVKSLLKKIVLSATYRQDSSLRSDLKIRDPQNVLLARGPAHRLSAEQVRDLALAASGLLDRRVGGPPVSPYQPGDLWREANTMSPAYKQSVGADLYRRSLYTVWKRTAPMPNMLVFDSMSREVCAARRGTTNTPLQSLVLLNDPQFVEAARVLAEEALKHDSDIIGRIRFAFRRLSGRIPTSRELSALEKLVIQQRAFYSSDLNSAARVASLGDRKADSALSAADVAAMTVTVQVILNSDSVVWKR